MRLAERLQRLGTENAFEVLAEVKLLEKQGRHIVSLAIGEPDFATPDHIKEAGIGAIAGDHTHYSPPGGIPQLREAIAQYIGRTRGIAVNPEQVVVTPGAKPVIMYSLLACVDPGDEVIYPNPGFPIYRSAIDFIGAKGIPLAIREDQDFSFDPAELADLITPRTKMIIINSPHNPTGGILRPQDMEMLAHLAVERDLWVLSDEIYSRILYDGDFRSIASYPGMAARTIILDGFSKSYAMTGWRLGFAVTEPGLAQYLSRLQTNIESCVATFTQLAGVEALLGCQSACQAMVEELAERGRLLVDLLQHMPGVKCSFPHGAFYVYANVTGLCHMLGLPDARALQRWLLYEAGVAVLPGTAFGPKNDDQEYLRLSFATGREQIREGVARMSQLVNRALAERR